MQQWKENKTVTYLLDSNIVSYALPEKSNGIIHISTRIIPLIC